MDGITVWGQNIRNQEKSKKLKMAFSIEVSGNRERPLWGNRERPQNTLKHDAHLLKMKMKWYFSTRIYQK